MFQNSEINYWEHQKRFWELIENSVIKQLDNGMLSSSNAVGNHLGEERLSHGEIHFKKIWTPIAWKRGEEGGMGIEKEMNWMPMCRVSGFWSSSVQL